MGIFLLRTDKMKLSVVCETTHSEFDVLLSPPLKVPPFKNSPPLSEYTVFPHMIICHHPLTVRRSGFHPDNLVSTTSGGTIF